MIILPESIVPVLGYSQEEGYGPFLGTGSFVGKSPLLLTAAHVIGDGVKNFGICLNTGKSLEFFPAKIVKTDFEVDLALLVVQGYSPPYVLPLANDNEITLNNLVSCFEYGTTKICGANIEFSPANRIGNVTRIIDETAMYNTAGKDMLELSFPALKGASGAPVVNVQYPYKLWGVIKANVDRDLLPIQITQSRNEKNEIEEETKFMLPQALAVHVCHVRTMLKELGELQSPYKFKKNL